MSFYHSIESIVILKDIQSCYNVTISNWKGRSITGDDCSLHVQVVAQDYEGMMKDAKVILNNIDKNVYIKVSVNVEVLKAEGFNVTATTIYTKFKAYLAISANVDYIALYFNRMENININPCDVIAEIANEIAIVKLKF